MKPQPPEYPRKVPSIDFDEDPILPGTIVYTEDSECEYTDAAEFARHKIAKKRRLERTAHAYLRGEGVFISTASLRGPFDNGWNNPWSGKDKKRKRCEVVDETAVSRAQVLLRKDESFGQTPWKTNQTRPTSPVKTLGTRTLDLNQKSPEEKVASWLRRNSALPAQKISTAPVSPTPVKRLSSEQITTRKEWTPTKQVIAVSSQDVKAPLQPPNLRFAESFETIVPAGSQYDQAANTHSRLQNALVTPVEAPGSIPSPVDYFDDHQTFARPAKRKVDELNRAEAAIKRVRLRTSESSVSASKEALPAPLHVVQVSTASDSAVPDAAGRGCTFGDNHQDKLLHKPQTSNDIPAATVNSATTSQAELRQPGARVDRQLIESYDEEEVESEGVVLEEQSLPKSNVPNSLAAAETLSTNLPPSAQPRFELQASISNRSSTNMMLPPAELLLKPSRKDSVASESSSPGSLMNQQNGEVSMHERNISATSATKHNEELAMTNGPTKTGLPSSGTKTEDKTATAISSTSSAGRPVEECECLGLVQGKDAPPLNKARSKRSKNTSFVTDSGSFPANSCIKNAMKVRKACDAVQSIKPSPPPPFFEPDVDMDTSIECIKAVHSPKVLRHSPYVSKQAGRSILKISGSASKALSDSPVRLHSTVSRRALLHSGQNGLEHEDGEGFDIDDALNEMGSFLSTWDAEKGALHL